MLTDLVKKINPVRNKISNGVKSEEIILILVIILTALSGFALGRISALGEEKFPIKIESGELPGTQEGSVIKSFVGSKNGAVYQYPSCPGAKQIKEENRIYFSSRGEAEKAGYRPAANCPGL